jgi:RNA polymerase sigma-70 factor, ECF subfamily
VDKAVVRHAQQGSEEAFGAIVNESIDRLFAISTLIARDRSLAEDAVQDALLRAWRDLPTLRDPDRLSAWLARLTVNATYDILRRRRRIRELKPLHETIATGTDEAAATVDRVVLWAAYGRLPVDQRAVVVLHYYVGLTLDEVANTLGIPAGTARSRLHGGLAAMRRSLGVNSVAGLAVPTETAQ